MIRAAFLLLLPSALASIKYVMTGDDESCTSACQGQGMTCNQEGIRQLKLATDTQAKAKALFDDLGINCDGFFANEWAPFHSFSSCFYLDKTEYLKLSIEDQADCDSHDLGNEFVCACDAPAAAASCVDPAENHELEVDANGIVAELNQCHFDVASDCACMEECQKDDYHLSFEWKEGEAPNCCCYVNV